MSVIVIVLSVTHFLLMLFFFVFNFVLIIMWVRLIYFENLFLTNKKIWIFFALPCFQIFFF